MDRALRIALLARRFSILARRPDLLYADRAGKLERFYDSMEPRTPLLKQLVLESDETDRLCALAVVMLNRKGMRRGELCELLSALDPDRIVAIAYALPWSARRRWDFLCQQAEWSREVSGIEEDIEQAMRDVMTLSALPGHLIKAALAGGDPMDTIPESVLQYLPDPDALRECLAEIAEAY